MYKTARIIGWIVLGMLNLRALCFAAEPPVLRDPTAPQIIPDKADPNPKQKGNLKVSAIFISADGPHAIINDVDVKEGEEVGGKKVIKINPYSVITRENGNDQTLYLLGAGDLMKGQAK